jgi:hypothetical protein
MDERLQKALEFSNYSATINNQKQNIKNRVNQLKTVHYNSGVFMAEQQTIAFAKTLVDMEIKSAIVEDSKGNPVEIKNTEDFLEQLMSAYTSAMTEFDAQTSKLKKIRNLKKLMEW